MFHAQYDLVVFYIHRKGGGRVSLVTEVKEINHWAIGQRIQEMRIKREMSGADIAAYLDITTNQVSRIENGRAKCTLEHLFILAQVLDCSADFLLYGTEPSSKYTKAQMACIDAMIASFEK